MKAAMIGLCFLAFASNSAFAGTASRPEIEYYVAAYAAHYRLPLAFVRALIDEESGWRPCAVSLKGARGLMQLMPETARLLDVDNACDIRQNLSGGTRYLAYLRDKFHGDLRLVAAAYCAGEAIVAKRGLDYSNRQVVAYVAKIQGRMALEQAAASPHVQPWRLP